LGPDETLESLVELAVDINNKQIYFPHIVIFNSEGDSGEISNVEAHIVYRLAVGALAFDVYIRLINSGRATVSIIWYVLTFAS
jgi:hypothetical protein